MCARAVVDPQDLWCAASVVSRIEAMQKIGTWMEGRKSVPLVAKPGYGAGVF